jgi:hypothetical protein
VKRNEINIWERDCAAIEPEVNAIQPETAFQIHSSTQIRNETLKIVKLLIKDLNLISLTKGFLKSQSVLNSDQLKMALIPVLIF